MALRWVVFTAYVSEHLLLFVPLRVDNCACLLAVSSQRLADGCVVPDIDASEGLWTGMGACLLCYPATSSC